MKREAVSCAARKIELVSATGDVFVTRLLHQQYLLYRRTSSAAATRPPVDGRAARHRSGFKKITTLSCAYAHAYSAPGGRVVKIACLGLLWRSPCLPARYRGHASDDERRQTINADANSGEVAASAGRQFRQSRAASAMCDRARGARRRHYSPGWLTGELADASVAVARFLSESEFTGPHRAEALHLVLKQLRARTEPDRVLACELV